MLKESSVWLRTDQHSRLIGTNANNREVMDNEGTAWAQDGRISLPCFQPHTTPLSMSVDPWPIWMWLRRSVDVTLTKEAHWKLWFNDSLWGVYRLCFLRLIQDRPLKALIGVQMCPFLLHLFGLLLSWFEWDQPFVSVWSLQCGFMQQAKGFLWCINDKVFLPRYQRMLSTPAHKVLIGHCPVTRMYKVPLPSSRWLNASVHVTVRQSEQCSVTM